MVSFLSLLAVLQWNLTYNPGKFLPKTEESSHFVWWSSHSIGKYSLLSISLHLYDISYVHPVANWIKSLIYMFTIWSTFHKRDIPKRLFFCMHFTRSTSLFNGNYQFTVYSQYSSLAWRLVYRKYPAKRNLNHTPVKSNTIIILIKNKLRLTRSQSVQLRLFHWTTDLFLWLTRYSSLNNFLWHITAIIKRNRFCWWCTIGTCQNTVNKPWFECILSH